MNVWRIGSNWGGIDIFPLFMEHSIAFTGTTVEENVARVKVGDLIVVTRGQPIIAVAMVKRKGFLRNVSADYVNEFADVSCLHLEKIYSREDFPTIDFGYYDRQGKKFHEAHGSYRDDIFRLFNQVTSQSMSQEIVQLLKYKKQIILQGPPGTGKTKLAKKLASELTGGEPVETEIASTIDKATIQRILKEVGSIKTKSGKELKIVEIKDGVVDVKTNDSEVWSPSYNKIIESYNNKLFDNEGRAGGFIPYEDAIAKYLFENHRTPELETASGQVKLIQFHPSYSYEDFVRGIVAEAKGDRIEYKNVNKLLGKFAEEALKNWTDVHRDSGSVSKENRTREYFEAFVDDLGDRITNGEKIILTNSVSIVDVDEDAFRYKGNDGWSLLGNRMLFKDIIKSFLDGNTVRQDIKKNKNLSGLAKQHATYFLKVLKMFQAFLMNNHLTFDDLRIEKQKPKNYVLIIDEINRANLSSVLGELIYALEYRGEKVESMYAVDDNNALVLPPNLYIIGTMNTADRSVGHIDYAIRRRFAFVDVMPKDLSTEIGATFHKALFDEVAALFDSHLSAEFEKKDVQLGHSYFIDKSPEGGSIAVRLQYEIKPILLEYIKDGILVGDDIKQKVENLIA